MTYDAFINQELILFSIADNMRSIPALMDGLKPAQRKASLAMMTIRHTPNGWIDAVYDVLWLGSGAVRLLQAQPQEGDQGGAAGGLRVGALGLPPRRGGQVCTLPHIHNHQCMGS